MVGNVALERCAQFLFSGFESARAQLTQLVRVAFSCNDRSENRPPAYSQNRANHARQFDVRVFQRLLNSLGLPSDFSNELLSRSGQLSQFLDRRWRNEASSNETMGKQIRYPQGITDIALTTRHVLDVGRLCQHQLKMTFEHMPHRLPIHSGRFHRYNRATALPQPIQHFQQFARGRAEHTRLAHHLPLRRYPHASRNRFLVDVQSGASLMNHSHRSLLHVAPAWSPQTCNLIDALNYPSWNRKRNLGYAQDSQPNLTTGSVAPTLSRPLSRCHLHRLPRFIYSG